MGRRVACSGLGLPVTLSMNCQVFQWTCAAGRGVGRTTCCTRTRRSSSTPPARAERVSQNLWEESNPPPLPGFLCSPASGWKDLLRYVARAPGDWALIVRHHEFLLTVSKRTGLVLDQTPSTVCERAWEG